MLQCNRSLGLDANEIIRLTSAIGHNRTISLFGLRPFNGLLHFKSCRIANSSFSAKADISRLIRIGRLCVNYLPFSRSMGAMAGL